MKALVAILGLDSHWRGAVLVARVLRDAGLEVAYLGNQFPEQLVAQALQEDPSLIAVSSLSGSHGTLVPELMRELAARGVDAPVLVGGAIPPRDVPALREAGVAEVFTPGRPLDDLIAFVRALEAGSRDGAARP
ncbi:MAG: cobalamin B12-binding domain-containing protein [Candidatus Rokuibacteriota bacterium]